MVNLKTTTVMLCCGMSGLAFASSALADEPKHAYAQLRLQISKDGSFANTVPADTDIAGAIEAACRTFRGKDCAHLASETGSLIRASFVPHEIQDGNNYSGFWQAPSGYEICGAKIEWSRIAIDEGTTIASLIVRNANDYPDSPRNSVDLNGLAFDVKLAPANRVHGVNAAIDLDFIESGRVADLSYCVATGLRPWSCKGPAGGGCLDPRAKE
jgi:hypothetical protein